MNQLIYLQNSLQDYLLNNHSDIQLHIHTSENISAETRLSIYGNAYSIRLIEALAANFPTLKKYLGDDLFEKLGKSYLEKYPSTYRSIRWFGDKLPIFLLENTFYCDHPYLIELAQFEWAMTLVFDAADVPILKIEEVAAIPPEHWSHMRFQAHSSLQRLNLKWNVVQIYQAVNCDQPSLQPIQLPERNLWILWRKDLINQFCSIPESEACAIDMMLEGKTFSEICEGLCRWTDEEKVGVQAASLLKGWIQSGLLAGIRMLR